MAKSPYLARAIRLTALFSLLIAALMAGRAAESRPATLKDLRFLRNLLRDARFDKSVICYLQAQLQSKRGNFSGGNQKMTQLGVHFQTKGGLTGLLDMRLAFSVGDDWRAEVTAGYNGERLERIRVATTAGYSPWLMVEHDGQGRLIHAEAGNINHTYLCSHELEYPDDMIDPISDSEVEAFLTEERERLKPHEPVPPKPRALSTPGTPPVSDTQPALPTDLP